LRDYLLTDLDSAAMVEVIRRPTLKEPLPRTAEIPFQKYRGFDFDEGVPDEIARQVAARGRSDGVSLLLQIVCARLFEYAMARENHRVTLRDIRQIGGFDGAIARHVDRQIKEVFPKSWLAREQFRVLLTDLTLTQVDGTVTTALLPEADARRLWKGSMP